MFSASSQILAGRSQSTFLRLYIGLENEEVQEPVENQSHRY
jgi:hypothetical protein